jgi:tRNA G26 N,N-dimethylase Trm1
MADVPARKTAELISAAEKKASIDRLRTEDMELLLESLVAAINAETRHPTWMYNIKTLSGGRLSDFQATELKQINEQLEPKGYAAYTHFTHEGLIMIDYLA